MSTKAKALAVAKRFGFVLDTVNSGPEPIGYTVVFDHPTHSFAGDCRSITCANFTGSNGRTAAQESWAEAIERMESEAPLLESCTDPDCDYHAE
jgi:hypothetical protein